LRFISAGQPPGSSEPTCFNAAGMLSQPEPLLQLLGERVIP
jgi:hypothetical protein